MKNKYILLVVLILTLLAAVIFYRNQNVDKIEFKDVTSLEFYHYGTKKKVYTKDKNDEQMKEFITMYNKANYYDNTGGTTHSITVVITLTNNEKISIAGGTKGFQTVQKNGEQFNIKGKKLGDYFKKLNKEYEFLYSEEAIEKRKIMGGNRCLQE